MIRRRLRPICHVAVSHTYFASGVCPSLRLVPTQSCAAALQALDLQWQETAAGGTLHAWTEAQEELQQSRAFRLAPEAPLTFLLYSNDRAFVRYTELSASPFERDGVVGSLYFSNAASASGDSAGLHGSGLAVDSWVEWDMRRRIEVDPAATVTYANGVGVRDVAGPTLEMARLAEGRYSIVNRGDIVLDRWFSRADPLNVLGGVELFLFHEGSPSPIQPMEGLFTIQFQARATRWRYHLVPRTIEAISGSVVRLEGEAPFERIGVSTINGVACVTFESDAPIALGDNAKRARVVVLEDAAGRDRVRELALPSPDATRLEATSTDSARWISEVIAYV